MNTAALLLSVVFSSIGFGYFIYGKKQQQALPLICGLALMIYPYFMTNHWLLVLIGIVLSVLPYFIIL